MGAAGLNESRAVHGGVRGITGLRSVAERSRAHKDALVDAFWHLKDDVGAPVSSHVIEASGRHQFPASFDTVGNSRA